MNRSIRFLLALSALVLASMACQVLGSAPTAEPIDSAPAGDTQPIAPEPTQEVEQPAAPASGSGLDTEFPLPDDAMNGMDLGNDMISFQTNLSITDALAFYREALTAEGYVEREITTAVTDTTFSIVFDGHESGKAIVVQAVDLGSGTVNITIRFEDV